MEASILLVEDTVSDAELIREAFRDSEFQHRIDLVTDGEEALRLLREVEEKPHLILLDLNLPKKNGLEVLREIRKDPDPFLSIVPVVVLTNSRSRQDALSAYIQGCNAFIRKPMGFERLVEVVQSTGRFWFNCALVPEEVRGDMIQPASSRTPIPKKRHKK